MALEIADFTGTVIAPGGAYPYGDVKDAPTGTVVDKKMVADLIQMGQRAMAKGNITPNSLPDNSTNDFQLYEALQKIPAELVIGTGSFVSPLLVSFEYNYSILFTSAIPLNPTLELSPINAIPGHKVHVHWVGNAGGSTITITATGTGIVVGDTTAGLAAGINGIAEFTYLGNDGTNDIYLSKIY